MNRARDWFAQAQEDLDSAKKMLSSKDYEWTCFIAQQSAEKSIKALLEANHVRAWGHDLLDLLNTLPSTIEVPSNVREGAHRLNLYYSASRYPDAFTNGYPAQKFSAKQAQQAIEDAEVILDFIRPYI
jgi:HEPN domain-containing protein